MLYVRQSRIMSFQQQFASEPVCIPNRKRKDMDEELQYKAELDKRVERDTIKYVPILAQSLG